MTEHDKARAQILSLLVEHFPLPDGCPNGDDQKCPKDIDCYGCFTDAILAATDPDTGKRVLAVLAAD